MALGVIGYYKITYPEYIYRYRIILEVDTPEGIKEGSSVVEVKTRQWPAWMSPGGGVTKARNAWGEAPYVDLGKRGILFTALSTDFYRRIYFQTYLRVKKTLGKSQPIPDYATADFSADLLKDEYPIFVVFNDLNDPMSVQEVDPDNLSDAFGNGFKLRRIKLEKTNAELSWKIEKNLKWISQYYDKLFDGRRIHTIEAENKLANKLGAGMFVAKKK